jgi:hypothetical protein
MPGGGSYADDKYIYSVDMIFVWLRRNPVKPKRVKVSELEHVLKEGRWGEDPNGILATPMDVLGNPDKYPDQAKRIHDANLRYPIIMDYRGRVVDGIHRVTKAHLEGKKTIRAYILDKKTLGKFRIGKDSMHPHDILELYMRRFVD